ncbi:MAG: helix-turn-helix domain-containing protein [Clostridia bacterium]|nr:helix-turn-helix domain-containing protein [Clostridia bacterium]
MENAEILRFHFHTDEPPREVPAFVIPYVDITYLIEGELHYFMNDAPITLHAGEAIVFPVGAKRERPASTARATFASLNLSIPKDADFPLCGVIKNAVDSDCVFFLKRLYECYRTESAKRSQKCEALLSYLYHRLTEVAMGGGNPYINRVKQMILDDPSARYTLAKIAGLVHISPQYLCAIFKKHEGCRLFEYIERKRIDHAKKLILCYNIPLSKIAQQAGFGDYFSFAHAFKKHEGITAMQFKKGVPYKNALITK